MNYANHDSGLSSRPNNGTSYEERIDNALIELERAGNDFEIVEDEDMGFIQIYYKNKILVTLSDNMSAIENWLLIKPVWRLLSILEELSE